MQDFIFDDYVLKEQMLNNNHKNPHVWVNLMSFDKFSKNIFHCKLHFINLLKQAIEIFMNVPIAFNITWIKHKCYGVFSLIIGTMHHNNKLTIKIRITSTTHNWKLKANTIRFINKPSSNKSKIPKKPCAMLSYVTKISCLHHQILTLIH